MNALVNWLHFKMFTLGPLQVIFFFPFMSAFTKEKNFFLAQQKSKQRKLVFNKEEKC